MSKLISLTSGSKPILTNIMTKYPGHQLMMYKSLTENNFQLIDWFMNKSIFKLPRTYRIIQSSNLIYKGPFINLIFLTLGPKERKILFAYVNSQLRHLLPLHMSSLFELQSVENSSKMSIVTSWDTDATYLTWIKHSFIQRFIAKYTYNDYFYNNLVRIR